MPKAEYKILIVDDDKEMQNILSARLSRESIFHIYVANNGQDGLYNVQANHPDLILLDIKMPVMDGITMMQELRKNSEFDDIKVIFLTNYDTDEETLAHITNLKPAFYVIKSNIGMDDLVRRIRSSLNINHTN